MSASIEIDIRDEEPSVLVFSGSSTFELVLGSVSVTMTMEQFDKLCEQMRAWIVEDSTGQTSRGDAPCDMGEMCLGCTPRNADGSCPDAAPAGSGEVHRAMNAIETVAWLALRKTPEQLGEEAWLAIKHPPHPSEVPHIQRFDWTEDGMEPVRPECHGPNEYVRWDDYAALLRKLSTAGPGEVE